MQPSASALKSDINDACIPGRRRPGSRLKIKSRSVAERAATKRNDQSRVEDELSLALKDCAEYARKGYEIARGVIDSLALDLDSLDKELSGCHSLLKNGNINTPEIIRQLEAQQVSLRQDISGIKNNTARYIRDCFTRLGSFKLSLFARTMAGKSTLMEILIKGDGKSIGQGAQRTTRDVREYEWKKLKVVDVPGIGAFKGRKDEELAMKMAASADMVIFLITDDAPQPVEAEFYARVRRLGKPVICICNVKEACDDPDDLELFLKNPDMVFNADRLKAIVSQFHAFVDEYMPEERMPFFMTHLRSRFLAGVPAYSKDKVRLLKVSRFDVVEKSIITEILERGRFLRLKSFVDGVSVPLIDTMGRLLDSGTKNASNAGILKDKLAHLEDWMGKFRKDGLQSIESTVSRAVGVLREDVPEFAEDHYDDADAGKKWGNHVNKSGAMPGIRKLQKSLVDECHSALRELVREIKSEVSLVEGFVTDRTITMQGIFDWRRAVSWGSGVISGGLGVAALVVEGLSLGPIGWVALAVGFIGKIGSWLFGSREKKIRKARKKLSKKLYEMLKSSEENLKSSLKNWVANEILQKINVVKSELSLITKSVQATADAQMKAAWLLNTRHKELNHRLLDAIFLERNLLQTFRDDIIDIARVPGSSVMLLTKKGRSLSEDTVRYIKKLLGEKVWTTDSTGSRAAVIAGMIGISESDVLVKGNEASVKLIETTPETLTRLNLARQLSEINILAN